jgi:predicted nucleotidyltransferase
VPSLVEASLSADERRVLDRFIELLEAELGSDLRDVWLYGSRARGEPPGPHSDVDLLVITAGGSRRDRDLVWRLLRRAGGEVGSPSWSFMPRIWDPGRLEQRRQVDSFFMREVDRDKIILFSSS